MVLKLEFCAPADVPKSLPTKRINFESDNVKHKFDTFRTHNGTNYAKSTKIPSVLLILSIFNANVPHEYVLRLLRSQSFQCRMYKF